MASDDYITWSVPELTLRGAVTRNRNIDLIERENAGAGHPCIPVVDRDRQSTPIFSPLCVDTHEDIRDAPLRRVCSEPEVGRSEAYGDTPYFRPITVHQQEENKQKSAEMCNFGNKVSNWIEEHYANRNTTHTGSYESKPYLKSIEQPDFRRTISPIAMQSVLESEIEKVSGEIESLLGELGHLSDVSGRDSLTPSPRTNMVVQHQHEQQNFAGSLQRQPAAFKVENQQEPPVTNFQQIDQQVINRPQPVNNSHQQDIIPITTDEMPSNHVLHFPPSVQHDNIYRQQDQQVASHLQQAAPAYHRSSTSENPAKQHRNIYKPDTPTVERVQPFPPPIQHDDYHRQPEFNQHVHQTSGIHSPHPISKQIGGYSKTNSPCNNRQQQDMTSHHFQPSTQGNRSTTIPSTNQYQLNTNNIQSGVNRVQQPTVQSQTYVPSHQQVPKTSDWFHQPTTKCQQGSTTDSLAWRNDSVFETLAQKPYIIRETTMHGAVKDMIMTCRITNPLEFSIHHLIFNETLHVAPIDCDMLLGANFLIKHGAILDVPPKKMNLKNTEVQLKLAGEPSPTHVPIVNRVTVQETIIVPPNTALRINLKSADMTSDYLIEPKDNSTLLIPRTVCAKGQQPTLCFLNITDHPVKLPKGDEVGYTQEVRVIQSLEDEPLPSVGTCTTNSKAKNSSKPGIPSHLKDLYTDSSSNLSQSQQTLLRQLLIKQQPLTNVSTAMVHLFSTPKPETLALPQAPDIIQDVSALPDVDCNLDLTVSAPTQKHQEVNDTWFSTHIELICSPTTPQIIASDENSCHVAAVTHMASQSDQGKVDDNNNRSRLVVVEKPMLGRGITVERGGETYYKVTLVSSIVEEQVGEEVPLDPQDEEKTPPEAKLAEVPSLQAELTKLVVTVSEAPQNIEVSPQYGVAAEPAYYKCVQGDGLAYLGLVPHSACDQYRQPSVCSPLEDDGNLDPPVATLKTEYNSHGEIQSSWPRGRLENFNARNRQFYQLSTAKVVLPQDEKEDEVVSQHPAEKVALQQEEEVVASQQQEETVVLQQEEVALQENSSLSLEEIPMEDRKIVILQTGAERRMVPTRSLKDLRLVARERFSGRGEAILYYQGMVLDPLITLKDIIQMETRPTIEV
ncbi:unnamed protein product [Mytilus coruscus]|uniref:Uncharacterized protein n=1 Tax=Mytilus coruscus TaxID=42192 RepID=A0A6J8C9R3_MYTCO|nr:unnamed protein product [Mytilus coruscus]